MTNSFDTYPLSKLPGTIKSLCVPFEAKPGFAIPLVHTDIRSNHLYIQRVGRARRIVGFDAFYDRAKTVSLQSALDVEVGDEEYFGVIDPRGVPSAGTRKMLVPRISKWLEDIGRPLSRMTFARFCGNMEAAVEAADDVLGSKAKDFGDKSRAIRWFIDITIIVEVRSLLARSYGTDDLSIVWSEVPEKGRVKINLPNELLQNKHLLSKKNRAQLSEILEFGRLSTGRDFDLVSAEREHHASEESLRSKVLKAAQDISYMKRQQQRLAEVIKVIISEPKLGWSLIDVYKDRSVFVNQTLEKIRGTPFLEFSARELELHFAEMIPIIIRSAYPMQRGELLLEFALKIGDRKDVRDVITSIVMRSRAIDVVAVRSRILEILGE